MLVPYRSKCLGVSSSQQMSNHTAVVENARNADVAESQPLILIETTMAIIFDIVVLGKIDSFGVSCLCVFSTGSMT